MTRYILAIIIDISVSANKVLIMNFFSESTNEINVHTMTEVHAEHGKIKTTVLPKTIT